MIDISIIVIILAVVGLLFLVGHSLTALVLLYDHLFTLILSMCKIKAMFVEFAVQRIRKRKQSNTQ
jgi:hypothetical protein